MLCCHGNSCRDCRYRENRGWYRGFNLSYERAKTAVLGKIVGLLRMKLDPQRGVFWRHLGDFLQVIEAGKNDVVNNVAALKRGWLGNHVEPEKQEHEIIGARRGQGCSGTI